MDAAITTELIAPSFHAIVVMVIVVIALFLFAKEELPLASSSLLVLVILILFFELFPFETGGKILGAKQFFSGFGHEALIAVSALMIAGQGLVRTGALEPIGRQLARYWSSYPRLSMIATLFAGAVLSAFVNNTPIVILLLPILISVSLRTGTKASHTLMPMGFATLIGGTTTTIGTSTNLLVVFVAADLGLRQFGMFDFAIPAILAGTVGLFYLWLIAPRLIPEREPMLKTTSPRMFRAQLHISEESIANGKTIAEILSLTDGRMEIEQVLRGDRAYCLVTLPDVSVRADDRIVVFDTPERLMEYEKLLEAKLYSKNAPVDEQHPLIDDKQQIAEVAVVRGSPLERTTLQDYQFSARYQVMVLALHRAGIWPRRGNRMPLEHPEETRLKNGDVILLQGSKRKIKQLKSKGELLVLDATEDLAHSAKAPVALGIMLAIVAVAALGILPIAVSAAAGVLTMLLTGCLRWKEASRALHASVIMIIVTSLALGLALVETGGAQYLASAYVVATSGLPPVYVLSGLLLVMAILTNVVSNNAAAVVGTPIAIGIAQQLGAPPEPFVLAVLFGANLSFATPMAYQTNLLVMNAGNYSFGDFLRVGVPLTILMWLLLSFLLPWLYGMI
jgi:di/tricarboxylate transporter